MTVVDKDHGYDRIIRDLYDLDGLAAWVGVLSGKEKYPDRTSVAKVAGIYQAKGGWLSATIDKRHSVFTQEFKEAQYNILIRGMNAVDALAAVAEKVRKEMVAEIENQGLVKTGLLRASIKWRIGVAVNRGRSGQQPRWQKIIRDGP